MHWDRLYHYQPEGTSSKATLLAGQAAEVPYHLDPVSGLAEVHEVSVANHVHGAWQLACRRLLRHLLDAEGLMVFVLRQAVLGFQEVAIIVLEKKWSFK